MLRKQIKQIMNKKTKDLSRGRERCDNCVNRKLRKMVQRVELAVHIQDS